MGIDDAKIAIEAGPTWQSVYELLEQLGYTVKLAHPHETRMIVKSKIKTDETDSYNLAQLLRMDFLPEAYVPPKHIRRLRELLYRRTYLVRMRTNLKNKIRAELSKLWIKLARGALSSKAFKKLLRSMGIHAVQEYLEVIEVLDELIKRLEEQITFLAGENADARLL